MNPAASIPSQAVHGGKRKRGRLPDSGDTPGDQYIWALGDRSNLEITLTFFGVLLFLTVIITYRFAVGDIAIALAAIGMVTDRKGVIFPRFLLFLVVFLAWCWLGVQTSRYPAPAYNFTLDLTKVGFAWWAALAAIRTRAQFRWAMIALVFLYASHPIRGAIFNIVIYNQTVMGRAVWNRIFANPNDLAALTVLFLTIAVGLVITERKGIIRLGALASCIVFPVIILYTQSRANFIGLAFLAFVIFAGQKKKARGLGLLVLIGVAAWATVPAEAWGRFAGVASLGDEDAVRALDDSGSANERLEIWRVGTRIAMENLVTGTGWGTFEYAHHETVVTNLSEFSYFRGRPTHRDAHSTYLTVLAETGIPGLILWLAAIGAVVFRAERSRRRYRSVAPKAALQLLMLEYGLAAYGIAGIWGSYASHSFLYFHLTWIWVAASLLEKDSQAFLELARKQGQGVGTGGPHPGQTPPVVRVPEQRPRFDPDLVGYPARSGASPAP